MAGRQQNEKVWILIQLSPCHLIDLLFTLTQYLSGFAFRSAQLKHLTTAFQHRLQRLGCADLFEEIRGIADAAGISLESMVLIHLSYECRQVRDRASDIDTILFGLC
jgi:hypothetical protein